MQRSKSMELDIKVKIIHEQMFIIETNVFHGNIEISKIILNCVFCHIMDCDT